MAEPTSSLRFRIAVGHNPGAGGGWTPVTKAYLPLSMAGTGAVLSMTATDLLRYARVHMDGPKRTASRQPILSRQGFRTMTTPQLDRKSVVWGKSVAVRLDLGGRRVIKKKKTVNQ